MILPYFSLCSGLFLGSLSANNIVNCSAFKRNSLMLNSGIFVLCCIHVLLTFLTLFNKVVLSHDLCLTRTAIFLFGAVLSSASSIYFYHSKFMLWILLSLLNGAVLLLNDLFNYDAYQRKIKKTRCHITVALPTSKPSAPNTSSSSSSSSYSSSSNENRTSNELVSLDTKLKSQDPIHQLLSLKEDYLQFEKEYILMKLNSIGLECPKCHSIPENALNEAKEHLRAKHWPDLIKMEMGKLQSTLGTGQIFEDYFEQLSADISFICECTNPDCKHTYCRFCSKPARKPRSILTLTLHPKSSSSSEQSSASVSEINAIDPRCTHNAPICEGTKRWAQMQMMKEMQAKIADWHSKIKCPKCKQHPNITNSTPNRIICTNCSVSYCLECGKKCEGANPYLHFTRGDCSLFMKRCKGGGRIMKKYEKIVEEEWKNKHQGFKEVEMDWE